MEMGTDDELQAAVLRQLWWAHELDIWVNAHRGAVTLTGFVQSCAIRLAIEETAKTVHGVRSVGNDIHVEPLLMADMSVPVLAGKYPAIGFGQT